MLEIMNKAVSLSLDNLFGIVYVAWVWAELPISISIIYYFWSNFNMYPRYISPFGIPGAATIMRLMLEIMTGAVEVLALAIYLAWFMSPRQIRMHCALCTLHYGLSHPHR